MAEKPAPLLEAALFMSSEPMTMKKLGKISGEKNEAVREALEKIRKRLAGGKHGIELYKSPDGYELRVKPEFLDDVSHLTPYADLSRGQLKVLALVAFKEPIKQSTIAKIIGNRAYSYIKDLEEKRLIRSEKYKRTKRLGITDEFKKYFGIQEREELEEKLEQALGKEAASTRKDDS